MVLTAQPMVLRQYGISMGAMGVVMACIHHLIHTQLLHQKFIKIQY